MDGRALIDRLRYQASVLRPLLEGVSEAQAVWRPAPESWSVLEVAAHLLDEEREDFRVRLEHTLNRPDAEWPPIDPQGWVSSRGYAEWDLRDTIGSFFSERVRSVEWLSSLDEPDWTRAHRHPQFGGMTAGDLLGSWVAHDLLHARQLVKLHYAYTQHLTLPHSLRYAGDW